MKDVIEEGIKQLKESGCQKPIVFCTEEQLDWYKKTHPESTVIQPEDEAGKIGTIAGIAVYIDNPLPLK